MRQLNQKRSRGRSGGRKGNSSGSNRTFESNGPNVKIRGNASQLFDKYQALARDASSSGDRIAAENYLQHAEHYFRILTAATSQQQRSQGQGGNGSKRPESTGAMVNGGRDGGEATHSELEAELNAALGNGGDPDEAPI